MQERAAKTRRVLSEAAADEFAERGYEGASLQRVVARADTSMGSLTFHFRTKTALADEVRALGRARLGERLDEELGVHDPLRELRVLIGALARAAHEDRFVRAAHRLDAGRPGGEPPLARVWLPVLRGLLRRACRAHRLRSGVSFEDAVALLTHLAEGAMAAHAASRDAAWHEAWDAVWDSVWEIVLHGLATGPPQGPEAGWRAPAPG
jgi:AcrR family transcriptional regulator